MAKNVCFISYDGMTDPLGQSQVLPYLCGLSTLGHSITLLSFEKSERYEVNKERIQKICKEFNIRWEPQFYTKNPPVFSTIKDIWTMLRVLKKLHKQQQFDILHARSYISMMAAFTFRSKGLKVIFDMRGFWADERIDGNIWNLSNPLFKSVYTFFKKKEKQWVEESDAVVSLTHAAAEYMKTQFDRKGNIDVIPCCTDESLFKPSGDAYTKTEDLLYLGSLGTWYLLDEMMAFFSVWKEYYPNSIFRFITMEPRSWIVNAAAKYGISEDDLQVGPAQRNEVSRRIEGAAAGIFFLKQSFSKMASSPVKQGEMMAMGLPIFCNTGVGDSGMIIEKYDSGILISEYKKENYRNAIIEFRHKRFDGTAIRIGAEDYFSLKKGIASYHQIYERL